MIPSWIERTATNEDYLAEVTRVMKQSHLGRENAAKLQTLADEILGIKPDAQGYANETRTLRRAFEIINTEYGGLVVSDTERGYWYASSLNDGLDAVDALKSRAKTILSNAHKVESNIINAYGGQMGLM
jgi:hypothetical protein